MIYHYTCIDCGCAAEAGGHSAKRCARCAKASNLKKAILRSRQNTADIKSGKKGRRKKPTTKAEGSWFPKKRDYAEQIRCCIECGIIDDRNHKPPSCATMAEAEAMT